MDVDTRSFEKGESSQHNFCKGSVNGDDEEEVFYDAGENIDHSSDSAPHDLSFSIANEDLTTEESDTSDVNSARNTVIIKIKEKEHSFNFGNLDDISTECASSGEENNALETGETELNCTTPSSDLIENETEKSEEVERSILNDRLDKISNIGEYNTSDEFFEKAPQKSPSSMEIMEEDSDDSVSDRLFIYENSPTENNEYIFAKTSDDKNVNETVESSVCLNSDKMEKSDENVEKNADTDEIVNDAIEKIIHEVTKKNTEVDEISEDRNEEKNDAPTERIVGAAEIQVLFSDATDAEKNSKKTVNVDVADLENSSAVVDVVDGELKNSSTNIDSGLVETSNREENDSLGVKINDEPEPNLISPNNGNVSKRFQSDYVEIDSSDKFNIIDDKIFSCQVLLFRIDFDEKFIQYERNKSEMLQTSKKNYVESNGYSDSDSEFACKVKRSKPLSSWKRRQASAASRSCNSKILSSDSDNEISDETLTNRRSRRTKLSQFNNGATNFNSINYREASSSNSTSTYIASSDSKETVSLLAGRLRRRSKRSTRSNRFRTSRDVSSSSESNVPLVSLLKSRKSGVSNNKKKIDLKEKKSAQNEKRLNLVSIPNLILVNNEYKCNKSAEFIYPCVSLPVISNVIECFKENSYRELIKLLDNGTSSISELSIQIENSPSKFTNRDNGVCRNPRKTRTSNDSYNFLEHSGEYKGNSKSLINVKGASHSLRARSAVKKYPRNAALVQNYVDSSPSESDEEPSPKKVKKLLRTRAEVSPIKKSSRKTRFVQTYAENSASDSSDKFQSEKFKILRNNAKTDEKTSTPRKNNRENVSKKCENDFISEKIKKKKHTTEVDNRYPKRRRN